MSAPAPRGFESGPVAAPPQVYRIDASDRLVDLNDAYVDDPGHRMPGEKVRLLLLGRDFWSLIPEAAAWYVPIVRITRAEQRPFTFAFRCDTPDLRRLMRMHIEADTDGSVCFTSSVIKQQSRAHVALLDPEAVVEAGLDLVAMCSWCKRVRTGDEWLEVEPALDRLGIDAHDPMPGVSHGICPRCKGELVEMTRSRAATMSIRLPGPTDLK